MEIGAGQRVLVTGGAGLLGRHITRLLASRGAEVIVFDLASYAGHEPSVRCVEGDVCDAAALRAATRGVDVVIHSAALIDISPVPHPKMAAINVEGTRNVIDACIANGVKVLVATSSVEAGGAGPFVRAGEAYPPPRDEASPVLEKSRNPYAEGKTAAEGLVLAAHGAPTASGRLATVCIRPGLVVGESGNISLAHALRRATQFGGLLTMYKMPASLSWVHPHNAALAHICAAERAPCSDAVGGAFFYAVDFDSNLLHVLRESFADLPITFVLLPPWLAMALTWSLDRAFRVAHSASLRLVGRRLQSNVWCLDYRAAKLSFNDFCFSGARARKHIGYASLETNGGVQLRSRAETLVEARAFSKAYYASLGGGFSIIRAVFSIVALGSHWAVRILGRGEYNILGVMAAVVVSLLRGKFRNFKPKSFLEEHESLLQIAKTSGDFTVGVQHYYATMAEIIGLGAGPFWHFVPVRRGWSIQQCHDRFHYDLVQHLLPAGVCDASVLEIGCGYGEIGRRVARLSGASVTGLTMAPGEVETANARAAAAGLQGRCRVVQGDYHAQPFDPCSFDAVFGIYCLKYSSQLDRAISEASRVLRPGGRFVSYEILVTDAHEPHNKEHARIANIISDSTSMPPLHSVQRFKDAAAAAGLKLVAEVELGAPADDSIAPWYTCFERNGLYTLLRNSWLLGALRLGERLCVLPAATASWFERHVVHPSVDLVDGGRLGTISGSLLMVWCKP